MSGLFQRIGRRPADPDATSVPEESGAPTQQIVTPAAPATAELPVSPAAPPQPADATHEMLAQAPAAASSEAQTTVQPPVATVPVSEPPAAAATPTSSAPAEPVMRRPGFRERGRMRRRLRYLRQLRELQVRDLGGLVFDLRRFERKRDDLVAQKIDQMRACDDEVQALEVALDERRDIRDVREPGIGGTCPRCFAIHGSSDHFCATCGAALGGAAQGPAHVAPAPAVPTTPTAPPAPAPPAPTAVATPPQPTAPTVAHDPPAAPVGADAPPPPR